MFTLGFGAYRLHSEPAPQAKTAAPWSSDLEELWRPFINTGKPLVISYGNPLFLQFSNKTVYRDRGSCQIEESGIGQQGDGQPGKPPRSLLRRSREVNAAFLLGQRLGPRQHGTSLIRSSQLSWQQMADANVLFLGPPRFFGERRGSMPVALEISETPEGFRILHPQASEPELFSYRDPAGFFGEDGEACVLVTHTLLDRALW